MEIMGVSFRTKDACSVCFVSYSDTDRHSDHHSDLTEIPMALGPLSLQQSLFALGGRLQNAEKKRQAQVCATS